MPIGLGWHFKRADAIANYAIFIPTGRYEDGAAYYASFKLTDDVIEGLPGIFVPGKTRCSRSVPR